MIIVEKFDTATIVVEIGIVLNIKILSKLYGLFIAKTFVIDIKKTNSLVGH
ncbi:MAG: hypothetical protein U9R32_08895 [Bacteroidota bacterium]|nr:hypothetical protein [Bacteroidota bacterium]